MATVRTETQMEGSDFRICGNSLLCILNRLSYSMPWRPSSLLIAFIAIVVILEVFSGTSGTKLLSNQLVHHTHTHADFSRLNNQCHDKT